MPPEHSGQKHPDAWALVVIVFVLLLVQAPAGGGYRNGDLRLRVEPFHSEMRAQRETVRGCIRDAVREFVQSIRVR